MSHAIKAKAKKIGPRRKPLDISGFPYTDYQTGSLSTLKYTKNNAMAQ